jgi:purine-nucleoside phosphorylase
VTPHNEAQKGDYAEGVLLAGDPARAEWIAANYFEASRRVNSIRGALGFTGVYRGIPVSVQTTGIGRASFSIYAHELLAFYDVRRAIRVGTCGGLEEHIRIRDVAIVQSARMDYDVEAGGVVLLPNPVLLERAVTLAATGNLPHHVGPLVSSDVFYHPTPLARFAKARAEGAIVCDMETAGLYAMAARFGARALSICTVVDNLVSGEETTLSERQALFANMVGLALDVLVETSDLPVSAGPA